MNNIFASLAPFGQKLMRLCSLVCFSFISACSTKTPPPLELAFTMDVTHGIQSLAWHPDGKRLAIGYFGRKEVQVWDIETKKPVFTVPSNRILINQSGQEVLFSPDGKYLVVQDFLDTKNGQPPFPTKDDETEIQARADRSRYLLARVWSVEIQKEVAQIYGPGARVYGAEHDGMCWSGEPGKQRLVMLRSTSVFIYDHITGKMVDEISLRYPFKEHPKINRGYAKMDCHPSQSSVALQGGIWGEVSRTSVPEKYGKTPIVIVDLSLRSVVKVLETPNPINGIVYNADGSKLMSFGVPPIHVWDANNDYTALGSINDPPQNTGIFAPMPGVDGVLGVADTIYLWDAAHLKKIGHAPSPRDLFRVASHGDSKTVVFASGHTAYFYRYNIESINSIIAKKGN
jgi:WD40 repeat protein